MANKTREVCVLKCDAGYGPHNADWVVVREDDPDFKDLSRMDRYADQVRPIQNLELYGVFSRYDFEGPC